MRRLQRAVSVAESDCGTTCRRCADRTYTQEHSLEDTELYSAVFPAPTWAVHGLIPVGVTLIAAKPKDGKSWWVTECSAAVADGRLAFQAYGTTQGDVLHLALEDNMRRMQKRLRRVDPSREANGKLTVWTEVAPFSEGGEKDLTDWLADHPDCKMVVVDNLRRFSPVSGGYTKESANIQRLNDFALKHSIAMPVVMHMYKGQISATNPDWMDRIQGGVGVTGAAECVLGIARARSGSAGVIRITGKDIENDDPIPMLFDRGRWIAGAGDDPTLGMSDERRECHQVVSSNPGLQARQIAERLGKSYSNVRMLLYNMVQDESLVRPLAGEHRGRYWTPGQFEQLDNTAQTNMLTPGGQLHVLPALPEAEAQ